VFSRVPDDSDPHCPMYVYSGLNLLGSPRMCGEHQDFPSWLGWESWEGASRLGWCCLVWSNLSPSLPCIQLGTFSGYDSSDSRRVEVIMGDWGNCEMCHPSFLRAAGPHLAIPKPLGLFFPGGLPALGLELPVQQLPGGPGSWWPAHRAACPAL
jgi:hypothetical protein